MVEVVIAGAGMTAFGKFLDRGVRSLTQEAVAAAMADANASYGDIGLVVFGNAMSGLVTGQECIRGEVALRGTPLTGQPMINVENACASGSTAVHVARMAVASGHVARSISISLPSSSLAEFITCRAAMHKRWKKFDTTFGCGGRFSHDGTSMLDQDCDHTMPFWRKFQRHSVLYMRRNEFVAEITHSSGAKRRNTAASAPFCAISPWNYFFSASRISVSSSTSLGPAGASAGLGMILLACLTIRKIINAKITKFTTALMNEP